ncbi:unnamed protein product [Oppiella nova]|uniref:NADH dehydrogenase [ubiquinone] 1 beta subcomplex subunit 11, mitochondrial n=1 Tax=Oppiella nova TaxID=334625 RepID=A0A7R9MD04_9ACAR|nr:unnamed protein product [Oppiella nova]CAG2174976.1 unnamed protein product [Oppiella nova]
MSNLLRTCLRPRLWANHWSKAVVAKHSANTCVIQRTCNRLINTSDKKKGHDSHDSHDLHDGSIPSFVPGFMDPQPKGPQTVREFADVESQKNWLTFGWDIGNRAEDRFINRWAFFLIVTMGAVIVPYIIMYYPDYKLYDWSVREAYLELDRRERLGLPLIDKNLIDPNLLELPSDEELGDTEIYI